LEEPLDGLPQGQTVSETLFFVGLESGMLSRTDWAVFGGTRFLQVMIFWSFGVIRNASR
jgi:hypothetical protein